VPAGVGLLELALVRLAGPPARQVEVLRQLGEGGTDPVAPLLALLALGAQGLAAYLLLVLGLRLLALVPGSVGRLAASVVVRVTPVAVRRALDLLLGGALLAQVTLAPLPARAAAAPPPLAAVPATTAPVGRSPAPLPPWLTPRPRSRPSSPAAAPDLAPVAPPGGSGAAAAPAPAECGAAPTTRPAVPGAAPAPTPGGPGATSATSPGAAGGSAPSGPGAAGGGSAVEPAGPEAPGTGPAPPQDAARPGAADGHRDTLAEGEHTIRAGDTLWGIAAAHLPPAKRSAAAIDRYWREVYRANRAVLGPDPDLIHPGTRLRLPPEQPDRR
jgi:resuscitation-promoting factor RpfA